MTEDIFLVEVGATVYYYDTPIKKAVVLRVDEDGEHLDLVTLGERPQWSDVPIVDAQGKALTLPDGTVRTRPTVVGKQPEYQVRREVKRGRGGWGTTPEPPDDGD